MRSYLLRHAQVLVSSVGRLVRTPVPTLLTITLLGVALALPTGLFVLVGNLERASAAWQGRPQISLFLSLGLVEADARSVAEAVRGLRDVEDVTFLSAESTLEEFQTSWGLGDAMEVLDENPLPAVVIVYPRRGSDDAHSLSQLARDLARVPHVEHVQLDLEWVQRLHAIIALFRRGALLMAGVLGVGVVLVVSNTTRLAVLSRSDEIELLDRLGGTAAFIRRPFLYAGTIQGAAGGLLAWWVVFGGIALLDGPARELAASYGGGFALRGVGAAEAGALLAIGGALGWVAARATLGWQLRRLKPA